MIHRFELRKVHYMPAKLDPGFLYVSKEFGAAAHLCACGCGTTVRTPLDRWSLTETQSGPSLDPSVGNWQEHCQSHYFIARGEVRWMGQWTPKQIRAGREYEQERICARYPEPQPKPVGAIRRILQWLRNIF